MDSYDIGHVTLSDRVYVDSSLTDSNSIVITDSIPWLNFEYILYSDSTFANYWLPTQKYGYFYSGGDSIFVHDVYNGPYYREWHCGRLGAGVNEISNSPFSVYPNPASNKIFISPIKALSNLQFKLFNSLGQSILEKSISLFQHTEEIDLPNLPNGIYFLKINSDKNNYTSKFIIQN